MLMGYGLVSQNGQYVWSSEHIWPHIFSMFFIWILCSPRVQRTVANSSECLGIKFSAFNFFCFLCIPQKLA